MKTKSRNLIISFLLTLAMLLGVFAMTPLTAFAISDADKPAETIYVGGVELSKGQYVKKGETTATTGEPDWEESGFAFYASSGTFHLSDYEYEGTGYTHDTSEKSVIYSEGKLEIILHGKNSIKNNTADTDIWTANGIRAKGNLIIDGPGSITVDAPYAICGDALVEFQYGKTLIPDATIAIEAGGNFIVDGGYVELHSTQPIYAAASSIISGSFTATAEQGVFEVAPTISADTENDYSLYICTDVAGNNQVAYNPENIKQYKYFAVLPPALTEIDSISVSGVTLPALGGKVGDASYAAATCGTGYSVFDMYVDMLVGDTWVATEDTASIVAGVKYRVFLGIDPEEGYTISADIAGANVLINGQQATEYKVFEYPDYNSIDICYEFSYEAPATDYDITIADKDGSGATVGVLITEENCTDVLGDGTVSYDPTTNTLTLNGYKYEGEGAEDDDIGYYGLMADLPVEGLTIVLVGENSIKLSDSNSVGMALFGNSDLTIKGDGSLTINTGMQGIIMAQNSSTIKIEGGNIDITTTAIAVSTKNFVMTGGNLKITTNMFGFATLSADGAFCINGGSLEISTAYAGYAFIYADIEHETYNPIAPDLSGYVGAYKMTASINADGSDATDFNEGYLNSYKYVKVEPTHVHDHGTAWESDANEHWNECACGDKTNKGAHNDGNADGKCDVCDYTISGSSSSSSIISTSSQSSNTSIVTSSSGVTSNTTSGGSSIVSSEAISIGNSVSSEASSSTIETSTSVQTSVSSQTSAVVSTSVTTSTSTSASGGGLSGGAIAGIVIGSVAVVGVGGFAIFWFVIKKKSFADLIAIFKKK